MKKPEHTPDDENCRLDKYEEDSFADITTTIRLGDREFRRGVKKIMKNGPTNTPELQPAPEVTISRRQHTALMVSAVVLGLTTAAATGAGLVYVGEAHMPTNGDVRAAALKDATTLLLTGTCTEELDAEAASLAAVPAAVQAHDTQHPSLEAYREGALLAKRYDVPCKPINNTDPVSLVNVRGHSFTVSGGVSVTVTPEAVPLLDEGFDVADVCNGIGLAVDKRNPALATHIATLRETAEPYCPTEPGPVTGGYATPAVPNYSPAARR